MRSEDIKNNYSMRDILQRYSIPVNRSGFARCPFHTGDREPSMKIYKDSFYCFGCGANGDIFTFVMMMDNCDFKTAFYSLGGEYNHEKTFKSNLGLYRIEKAKEQRRKEEQKKKDESELNIALISAYRSFLEQYRPLSDTWCDSINMLQIQLFKHGELNNIPY